MTSPASLVVSLAIVLATCDLASADDAFLLDESYFEKIDICVKAELENAIQKNKKLFRTRTRYIAAGNTKYSSCLMRFTPCGPITSGCAAITPSNFPINEGDVVEGELYKNGKLKKLDRCEQYKFVEPRSSSHVGVEHFGSGVWISQNNTLDCLWWTSGGGRFKGGGHVYGVCRAYLSPVLTNDDLTVATELCMDKLP